MDAGLWFLGYIYAYFVLVVLLAIPLYHLSKRYF